LDPDQRSPKGRPPPPALRASGLVAVLAVAFTATQPHGLGSELGGQQCPQFFLNECGSQAACTLIESPGIIDQVMWLLDGYDTEYGNVESCNEGRTGALDAFNEGQAYHVQDWGTCDYGGGMHAGGDGPIFVGDNMPIEDQAKRFWHEGWSRYHQCEDFICHDHEIMHADMEGCYGWVP
jgi:hypothetical protein